MKQKKGFFIVFEGPDKAGKTTQVPKTAEWLRSEGLDVYTTREPGGTSIGDQIRKIIADLSNREMHPLTEALLFQASRAQLVGEVIERIIAEGSIILCDRYKESSLIYQGLARKLGIPLVETLNEISTAGRDADLTLFFDVDAEVLTERMSKLGNLERIDLEGINFHRRVVDQYRQFYQKDQSGPKKWRRIDGVKSEEEVFGQVKKEVEGALLSNGIIERPLLGKER